MHVFTISITTELVHKMQQELLDKGFVLSPLPYAHFSAKFKGITCVLYTSGKLVVQGKDCQEFIEFYLEPEILHSVAHTYKDALITQDLTPRVGSDEAGKGDYFGPLVIAAAYVDPQTIPKLLAIGVKDSKQLRDSSILKCALEIRKLIPHEIVKISPKRYNELYLNFQNLNSLLAWAHATAIAQLTAKTGCKNVIVDQFASSHVLERAVKGKKIDIQLTQRTKGEEDIAVAAASILARAGFVEGIEALEKQYETPLPKGASKAVIEAGKTFVVKHGKLLLPEVAKMHFVTTATVLGGST